jgi:hypothetical protein
MLILRSYGNPQITLEFTDTPGYTVYIIVEPSKANAPSGKDNYWLLDLVINIALA